MANSKELFHDLTNQIYLDETVDEVQSILYLLFDHFFGLTRTDIISAKEIEIVDYAELAGAVHRINQHEPIQYILGYADFYGRDFIVNRSVLIPRPETELIVRELIDLYRGSSGVTQTIVDVGTGTGCIAITLALELPLFNVVATDSYEPALEVARANAKKFNTPIRFLLHDMVEDPLPFNFADVIVSNPPYVTESEKKDMKENVLQYEPAEAVFVADEDPLIFYRALAWQAWNALTLPGKVLVEINERFSQDVMNIFTTTGFRQVSVKQDINGKDRVVLAAR